MCVTSCVSCYVAFITELKATTNVLLKKLLATPKHAQDPATLAACRQMLDHVHVSQ